MDSNYAKLTVYFANPFWVGVFERIENGKLSACKVTFGAEPKDCEVWEFILRNYDRLKFSPSVDVVVKKEATNPKRIQREAGKQASSVGIGTKSKQVYNCKEKKTNSSGNLPAANGGRQKNSAGLNRNNRSERRSIGADNTPVAFLLFL